MEEIILEDGWRARLEALTSGRREAMTAAGVVGALVVAALLLWSRGAPAQIAPPAVAPSPGISAATSEVQGAVLLVHVAGAVVKPGLYELPLGARVADAIELAGGPRRRADLDLLNLAQPLIDGTKVEVPVRGGHPQATAATTGTSTEGAAGPAPVSLNSADQVALEAIPGIGPVKAAAIIAYRDETGGFTVLEDLLEVSGIGPVTFENLLPFVAL
jgi:competence protein ComEA